MSFNYRVAAVAMLCWCELLIISISMNIAGDFIIGAVFASLFLCILLVFLIFVAYYKYYGDKCNTVINQEALYTTCVFHVLICLILWILTKMFDNLDAHGNQESFNLLLIILAIITILLFGFVTPNNPCYKYIP